MPEFHEVDHIVTLVPQPDDTTCWAASMVMVINARGGHQTVENLCHEAGVNHDGKTWSEALPIGRDHFGMKEVYPACWDENGWSQVLSENGPLWTPVPGNEYHIIVLAGIKKEHGETRIHVLDPWPPNAGKDQWLPWADVERDYELGEGYGANLLAY